MLYQPPQLRGNPFSDAYFEALGGLRPDPACAHCGSSRGTRVTDGVTNWCDDDHRQLWIEAKVNAERMKFLVERGWSPERWEAARAARRPVTKKVKSTKRR